MTRLIILAIIVILGWQAYFKKQAEQIANAEQEVAQDAAPQSDAPRPEVLTSSPTSR
jgi:predicted negative regulator of RcsB-dependent stress response